MILFHFSETVRARVRDPFRLTPRAIQRSIFHVTRSDASISKNIIEPLKFQCHFLSLLKGVVEIKPEFHYIKLKCFDLFFPL